MWLLSTDRAELHLFASPELVTEGYAILSHVWDVREQTFQDLQKLQERCAISGENPRDIVCDKIRKCCKLAESHGYKWVWIDTCCIDKASSAELSEVVNSMFRYYARASICYGFLRDVPSVCDESEGCDAGTSWHPFLRSRWFRRGWTLQELIAPRFFLFVSRSWHVIGTKAHLAELLEDRTGIPAAVLRFQQAPREFGIAERMSWFGQRETTRLEDEAYCLLGLFDIYMPTLYGEGSNAFRRLQEEIMKQSVDTTLFAWGYAGPLDMLNMQPTRPVDGEAARADSGVFAPSPCVYQRRGIAYFHQIPSQRRGRLKALLAHLRPVPNHRPEKLVTFSLTPHGVLAYIPIIRIGGWTLGDLSWSIQVNEERLRVFLVLAPHPVSSHVSGSRLSYHIGGHCVVAGVAPGSKQRQMTPVYPRLVWISAMDDTERGGRVLINGLATRVSWEEVYLVHSTASFELSQRSHVQRSIPVMPMNLTLANPFRFDELSIRKFELQSGAELVSVANTELPWKGHPPATYFFRFSKSEWPFLVIQVGECQAEDPSRAEESESEHPDHAPLWATVRWMSGRETPPMMPPVDHDCDTDHVSQWPSFRRSFTQTQQGPHRETSPLLHYILLSFRRCRINPGRTLVLDVSYDGTTRAPTRSYSPLLFSRPSTAARTVTDQEHSADEWDASSTSSWSLILDGS